MFERSNVSGIAILNREAVAAVSPRSAMLQTVSSADGDDRTWSQKVEITAEDEDDVSDRV